MRKILSALIGVLALVALIGWPFLAGAQASQVTLVSSDRSFGAVPEPTFNGTITIACSSGGASGGKSIPIGTYEMRVSGEAGRICEGSSCTSATGAGFGATESRFYRFNTAGTKTCWSTNSLAVFSFTPVRF
jgi:hypothetical protein